MTRTQKYRQAALAYLVYGVVYWLGGYYMIEAGVSMRSGVLWLVIGAAFVLVFPVLIWKEFKWFTRILALFLGLRIVGLVRVIGTDEGASVPVPWGGSVPMRVGAGVFLLIAAAACFMLVRAGWAKPASEAPASEVNAG